MCKINEAAVYCGTYRKYNEASLFGKWMNLADYDSKEEFLEACAELHKDEEDPEFMFQDWENIPDGMIGESWIDERIWGLIESDIDDDVLEAYIGCFGLPDNKYDADDIAKEIRDKYVGYFDSDYDFGYAIAHDWGAIDIPESCEPYFDYESFGRDCGYDYSQFNGHYFQEW